jgi:PPP family 3-phenylpropionic acid transporter
MIPNASDISGRTKFRKPYPYFIRHPGFTIINLRAALYLCSVKDRTADSIGSETVMIDSDEALIGSRPHRFQWHFVPITTPLRQSLFYALLFAGSGASLPFIPLWLSAHGMAAGQIGIILAIPLLGRAVTGPLSGIWAERFVIYRTPMVLLGVVGAIAYALMMPGTLYGGLAFPVFLLLYFVGYTALTNIGPLLDAMTMQLARREKFTFATARAAGSAAFVFANVSLGFILQDGSTQTVLIWVVCAAILMALGGRYLLKPYSRAEAATDVVAPKIPGVQRFLQVIRGEGFILLIVSAGCLQAAHAFYYAFSTIIWKARDLSSGTCGLLWAAAIAGEIAFLTFGETFRRSLGPWRMLIVAGIFGIIRWSLMAFSPPLWALLPLQLFHGFTFAAGYLAALELVICLTPNSFDNLGQTVNSAFSAGLMTGVATLASGPLFEEIGPYGYGMMAALALAGTATSVWMYSRRTHLLKTAPRRPPYASSR